jgi:ketosteroid isomerase-like protein
VVHIERWPRRIAVRSVLSVEEDEMRILNLAAALLVIVGLAACAQPPLESSDSPEIAAGAKAWLDALNAGDIEAVVAVYTADARILPPNAELSTGHDAVRAIFGGMIDAGLGGNTETIEIRAAADIGYHVGTYTLETADGTTVDRGKFIETWRKIDGEWKISNDQFSSDLPATGAAGTTILVTHEVEEASRWLAAWQGEGIRHEHFAQHGAPNVRVFQHTEKANLTGLLIDVEDMEAFQAYLDSEDGAKAKAEDGVKDATMSVWAEVK